MIVDFIFDVASPNTYFAHKLIPDFEKRTGASFRYVPCLLGGIHKLTNNQPPFIAYATRNGFITQQASMYKAVLEQGLGVAWGSSAAARIAHLRATPSEYSL